MVIDRKNFNEIYIPYFREGRRYQIYFGGSSSGKSAFMAARCVIDVLQGHNILIVRKVARTLRPSCWNEVLKAIDRLKIRSMFEISASDMLITARKARTQLIFAGLDDVEKIKSLTPARGVLTDIWMEEATECRYSDFKQLDKRLRGLSSSPKRLTMTFNPVYKSHWIYKEFFSSWQEGRTAFPLPPRPGCSVPGRSLLTDTLSILKTTYRDNRFLSPDDRSALENEKDGYYYDVYTRGEWGAPGDTVFRSWRVEDLTELSPRFPDKRFGLDFGFAKDPTACICCALDREQRVVYIFGELYAHGLTAWALADRLRAFSRASPVTCDSAEPRSIEELRQLGIPARPARKGPDSVLHGIQWLQGYTLVVDPGCIHTLRELSQYRWEDSASHPGRPSPQGEDHLMDALRYALEDEMLPRDASLLPLPKGGIFP